jgi:hypothetical protein
MSDQKEIRTHSVIEAERILPMQNPPLLCRLGIHKWKFVGEAIPIVGNYLSNVYVCERCCATKRKQGREIVHLNE